MIRRDCTWHKQYRRRTVSGVDMRKPELRMPVSHQKVLALYMPTAQTRFCNVALMRTHTDLSCDADPQHHSEHEQAHQSNCFFSSLRILILTPPQHTLPSIWQGRTTMCPNASFPFTAEKAGRSWGTGAAPASVLSHHL